METALPLGGKQRGLTRRSWIAYFGSERLGLPDKVIGRVQAELSETAPAWRRRIGDSFLPPEHQELYLALLGERLAVLDLNG